MNATASDKKFGKKSGCSLTTMIETSWDGTIANDTPNRHSCESRNPGSFPSALSFIRTRPEPKTLDSRLLLRE